MNDEEDGFSNKGLYHPQDFIAHSSSGAMMFLGACDLRQPAVKVQLQYFQLPPYA